MRPTYGTFVNRLFAFAIDLVIAYFMTLPILVIALFSEVALSSGGASATAAFDARDVLAVAIPAVTIWLYFTIQESSLLQTTFGKRLMRLEVTDVAGEPITFARANARFWLRPLSIGLAGIGLLMMTRNRRHQGLHDLLSRTLVVRTDRDLGSLGGSGYYVAK